MMMYEPGQSLANELDTFLQSYWNAYRDYWQLQGSNDASEKEIRSAEQLDRLGEAFRASLRSLRAEPELLAAMSSILEKRANAGSYSQHDAVTVAKLFAAGGMVNDCIRINLAFETVGELLHSAEARTATLLDLITVRDLSPRALAYLDRATRLFLWGLDPECVIMCRSVLEAALEAALGDVLELDQPPPSLENLIRLAGEHQLLDGYETAKIRRGWRARHGTPLWQAERLRWAGNQVVHNIPDLATQHRDSIESAEGAIRELSKLLSALFPMR